MNPLGYQLPKELTLGYIAWYTVTNPKITVPRMTDLVTDLGLDLRIVPNPPRKGDAFKRACRYSEKTGLLIPGSEHRANILIRSVANTAVEIERHLILEVVDEEGRHLEYIDAAHMKFDRRENKLHVSKRQMDVLYDKIVLEALQEFHQNFENAIKHIDAQQIRRMIRDQLDLIGAIGVRKHGSVYFYHVQYEDIGLALEELCAQPEMGDGSDFHYLPLLDSDKQRQMVAHAFEDEVHERAVQIISELDDAKKTRKKLSVGVWTAYRKELDRLTSNAKEYRQLVDVEMNKASIELKTLASRLEDVITDDLINLK